MRSSRSHPGESAYLLYLHAFRLRRRRARPAAPVTPVASKASVAGSGTSSGGGVLPGQVPHRTFVILACKAPPVNSAVKDSGFAVTLNDPQSFATVVKLMFAGAKTNCASATL